MPQLPYSIELHDSRLASIAKVDTTASIVLGLSPAYLHRDGKGWVQEAQIVIAAATADCFQYELPARIADGSLKTPAGPYHNLLMLPLSQSGPVRLEIELESGEIVRVQGGSVEVRLFGEPEFIEDVA